MEKMMEQGNDNAIHQGTRKVGLGRGERGWFCVRIGLSLWDGGLSNRGPVWLHHGAPDEVVQGVGGGSLQLLVPLHDQLGVVMECDG